MVGQASILMARRRDRETHRYQSPGADPSVVTNKANSATSVKTSWRLWITRRDSDSVTPAQAGVQERIEAAWIPACAGMTWAHGAQLHWARRSRAARKFAQTHSTRRVGLTNKANLGSRLGTGDCRREATAGVMCETKPNLGGMGHPGKEPWNHGMVGWPGGPGLCETNPIGRWTGAPNKPNSQWAPAASRGPACETKPISSAGGSDEQSQFAGVCHSKGLARV
jgi:hypothetical protein